MAVPNMRSWTPGDLANEVLLNSQIRDPVTFHKARPWTYLTDTANQSIPNNTWTAVTWNTEIVDDPNAHGLAASTVTIQTGGLYCMRAQAFWSANLANGRAIRIVKVGGGGGTHCHSGVMSSGMTPDGGVYTAQNVETGVETGVYRFLPAGEVLQVEVFQDSGGALDLQRSSTQYLSWLSVRWIASS